MQIDDMILVSNDDHVIEPPDMFERHVPAKWAADAPRVVTEDGVEQWVYQGGRSGSMGLNAVVTWPAEEWGMDPASFAEMRPGAYDVHERIRDMNRNGVFGSMCFPTFPGFSAGHLTRAPDRDLTLVMIQAYNDWHIDEWATAYPGRFIPLAIVPTWDPVLAAAEVRRVHAKGCPAITMPELPHIEGLPSYHQIEHWTPLFDALCDTGVVMCLHIGQGFAAITNPPDAPIDNLIILATQVSVLAAQDLLWGPAFRTFPDLKVAWSEAGIGWIPFYLDRCDRHYTNQRWLRRDFGGRLPSDVFRAHSLACYVTDPVALKVRHDIGMDIIAWECDYPHSDSIWPDAPETVLREMNGAGVTDDEIDKITWQNTCRFFQWDPFRHTPKEQATVGALRAQATDVDTTVRSRTEWAARYAAAHAGT
jgi:predicted TIM-barrel fold metal-dependent hydrolase